MHTFYKIGFYILLSLVAAMVWVFIKVNPMLTEGANSWLDLYSADAPATLSFLEKHFGVLQKDKKLSASGSDYYLLKAQGQLWPFAGLMQIGEYEKGLGLAPRASIYLTVKDYASKHKELMDAGAKPIIDNKEAGGMRFGIYVIPGGIDLGVVEWDSNAK